MSNYTLSTGFPAKVDTLPSYYNMDLFIMQGSGRIMAAQMDSKLGQIVSIFEYSSGTEKHNSESYKDIDKFLQEENLVNKPYRSVIFGSEQPFSTLVPSELFDERKLEKYLSVGYELPAGHTMRSDEIIASGIRNVYCLPEELSEILRSRLPNAKICHYVTALISGLIRVIRMNLLFAG